MHEPVRVHSGQFVPQTVQPACWLTGHCAGMEDYNGVIRSRPSCWQAGGRFVQTGSKRTAFGADTLNQSAF
jgi:hypothetical protein